MTKIYILRDEGVAALQEIRSNTQTSSRSYDKSYKDLWKWYVQEITNNLKEAIEQTGLRLKFDIHSREEIYKQKKKYWNGKPVISLDAYAGSDVSKLGVSRIFDSKGESKLEVGNRPGYKDLQSQLAHIKSSGADTHVILDEDDICTGGTMRFILDFLHDRNIIVDMVTVGIQTGDVSQMNTQFKAIYSYKPDIVHDLSDPRDFLFGSYEGGLVLKYNGTPIRVPIIYPFVNVQEIGVSSNKAAFFSKNIVHTNRLFYTNLQQITGKPILLQDVSQNFQLFMKRSFSISHQTPMLEVIDHLESVIKNNERISSSNSGC